MVVTWEQPLVALMRPYRFRGKSRLLGALCPHAGRRDVRLFGATLALDLSDFMQREIYLGLFEPQETALVRSYLAPGMTVVDVGANIGYYVLLAASRVGSAGHVLAFEPSPWACDRLRRTVADNDLSDVVVVEQQAVGDRTCTASLFMPGSPGNHTPSMLGGGSDATRVAVPVVALDESFQNHRIGRVDLLKVDVEGFEPNVLAGAKNSLGRGAVRALLCEFNRYWLGENGTTSETLYEEILRYGFRPSSALGPAPTQTILFQLR